MEIGSDVSKEELDRLVRHHVWASVGVGMIPIPVIDMIALTAIQINLVRKIAKAYEIPFLRDKVKNIVGSLLGSVIPSAAGTPLAVSVTKTVPVIGQSVGVLTMPVIAGASTYAVAKVFIQHFASGGTFLTFDPEQVKDYYAEMFKEGREITKEGEILAADVQKDRAGGNVMAELKIEIGKNNVSFLSEGTKIAGHLYMPKTYKKGKKLPTIITITPTGGVKEQTAGLYAEKLSEKGFITLAFDHRTYGESEGEPRCYENPFNKCDDISNAISFMRTLDEVDADKIGLLGVCAGATFGLQSAIFDRRVKAFATVSGMFDSATVLLGMMGGKEGFQQFMLRSSLAAQKYYETGEVEYDPVVPDVMKDAPDEFSRGAYDYYRTSRAACPTWKNQIATMSWFKNAAISPVPMAGLLSPTPLLTVVGSKALTIPQSQAVIDNAEEPKEIFRIAGATHVDLYDIEKYVKQAVEKLSDFYGKNLK